MFQDLHLALSICHCEGHSDSRMNFPVLWEFSKKKQERDWRLGIKEWFVLLDLVFGLWVFFLVLLPQSLRYWEHRHIHQA